MTDYTPMTLRAAADMYPDLYSPGQMRAHAAAWEADLARVEALDSIIEAAKHHGSHSAEVALLVNAAVAKRLDEEYKAALAAAPDASSDATDAASPRQGGKAVEGGEA